MAQDPYTSVGGKKPRGLRQREVELAGALQEAQTPGMAGIETQRRVKRARAALKRQQRVARGLPALE